MRFGQKEFLELFDATVEHRDAKRLSQVAHNLRLLLEGEASGSIEVAPRLSDEQVDAISGRELSIRAAGLAASFAQNS